MEVKQIDAKDTYKLRNKVLRPGRPIEECMFGGDNDELTFHLGAYEHKNLVSVASFYFENNNALSDQYQFRLRGMATDENFRNKGMSKALLESAFTIIKKNHVNILWCNARTSALGFYEKIGFKTKGNEFDIKDIGPHFLMYKMI
ncbi:MAG: GNAT family N-acetyltransferase [Bacteriovoracaceae bacterium]|jgi:predicted GNAT family N-acyltransferase|nr:GNAT family N-acetyltransferase [Bacteriovoracaceae bacterium]